jgi:hypothetical protein
LTLATSCSSITLELLRVVIPSGWWSEWLQDVRCLRDLHTTRRESLILSLLLTLNCYTAKHTYETLCIPRIAESKYCGAILVHENIYYESTPLLYVQKVSIVPETIRRTPFNITHSFNRIIPYTFDHPITTLHLPNQPLNLPAIPQYPWLPLSSHIHRNPPPSSYYIKSDWFVLSRPTCLSKINTTPKHATTTSIHA